MADTFELTLNNPLTEEQWDMITDVDFDHTDRIWFHTKHCKEVEFVKVIRCKDCIYYDKPHVENNGTRIEYDDLPEEAFENCIGGLVDSYYGINVGGRCCRDYNVGYSEDKRVFVPETNYCGRAERKTE